MAGWVDVRRDQGKMVFFDFRDFSGKVQCIVLPNHAEAIALAKEIRPEWVLKLEGIVNKRPEKNVNPNIASGDVELEVTGIEVLNKSETPPFELNTDTMHVSEETRMKYKYLDLRTERMQKVAAVSGELLERSFALFRLRHDGASILARARVAVG